jgi:glycosyltransferase involved in cell wall biosynthesis
MLNGVKILHISTADNGGGASRAAYRLHDGLRRAGEDSRMYVLDKYTSDEEVVQFHSARGAMAWLARNTRRLRLNLTLRRYAKTSPPERTFFSEDRTPFYKDACRRMPKAELVNLHWMPGFLDLGAFFGWLPEEMPVVWTLHDMASFTGGCCHAMGCERFTQQCGACPQLGSKKEGDLTREVWRRKQKYYAALDPSRFHIVTPSRWLGEEVRRSPLLGRFPRSVIPYGLDTEVFQPRDRRFSREVLGIPQDANVILFVSNGLHVHLKGFKHLMAALEGMDAGSADPGGIFLLCLGFGAAPALERFPHTHIASINEDRALSMVYSAADVFVLPSLADNLPNTMLEAMACGTPVVAFAAGGIPEAVRPGVTGLLAKTGDAAELRAAMLELLGNDAKRAEMSANCRRVALAEYDLSVQTGRYVQLYTEMLGQGVGGAGKEAAVHSAAAS